MSAPAARRRDPRRVLVLGDANVDLTLHVPERRADGRREVREPVLSGGGTAANTARALAALGVPVAFAGAIGDDAFGRWVTADLAARGVDTSGLAVVEPATCQVIAMVEPDGERSLVVWPPDGGALRWLRPGDVPDAAIVGAAWLHTTGMCLRDEPARGAVLAAMAAARAAGVPVSIDLNLRVELWGLDPDRRAVAERAIELADVVLGSGPEELVPLAAGLRPAGVEASGDADRGGAEAAGGRSTDADRGGAEAAGGRSTRDADRGGAEAIALAVRALASGERTVVARLGAAGAVACSPDGAIVRSPGFEVAALNIVGAGDAFNAGFIAASAEGRPLEAALRLGNAVAAGRVSRAVGSDPPTRAEAEAMLA